MCYEVDAVSKISSREKLTFIRLLFGDFDFFFLSLLSEDSADWHLTTANNSRTAFSAVNRSVIRGKHLPVDSLSSCHCVLFCFVFFPPVFQSQEIPK